MRLLKFKTISTPRTFADVERLKSKLEPNVLYADKENACLWMVDSNDRMTLHAVFIPRAGYDGTSGHVPQKVGLMSRTKFNDFRQKVLKRVGVYAAYDASDLRVILTRVASLSNLNEQRKQEWLKLRRFVSGIEQKPKMDCELGVELELESDETITQDCRNELASKYKKLIHDVGSDCSVVGGTEIRFNHPELKGWKLKEVSKILDSAKEIGLKSEYGTAGMHIHVSHPKIEVAVTRARQNLGFIQDILYPISCRTKQVGKETDRRDAYFGIRDNIMRDQLSDFGTLEFRAWKATTDPKVFMARLRIAKALVEYLVKVNDVNAEDFLKTADKKVRQDYKFLLKTENPHEFGFSEKVMKAMMN